MTDRGGAMRKRAMTAVLLLAACGGGGGGDGGGSGVDPRLARLDVYESQRLRVLGDPGAGVMGMAPTPDIAMPATGTAEFNGSATIRVETAPAALVLYGDAAVTVGFQDGTVSGNMDRFFGTNDSGNVVDYSGAITIDGGTVGGSAENAVTLDYAGALSASGETLVFDGTLEGGFLGDPVAALSASDLEAVVDTTSGNMDATFVMIGETSGVVDDPLTPP